MAKKYVTFYQTIGILLIAEFILMPVPLSAGQEHHILPQVSLHNTLSPALTIPAPTLLAAFQQGHTAHLTQPIPLSNEGMRIAAANFLNRHRTFIQQAIESTVAISEELMQSDWEKIKTALVKLSTIASTMEQFYTDYRLFKSNLLHAANSNQRLVLIALIAAIDYSVGTAPISEQFNALKIKTMIEQINQHVDANANAARDGRPTLLLINKRYFQEFFAIYYSLGALKDYLIRFEEHVKLFSQATDAATPRKKSATVIPFTRSTKRAFSPLQEIGNAI
ncbi:MAG: hypothetical protein NC924_09055 [Candidatus Omnitrophica bacterium]|nr:hypothetical protein [Candidatus Omnitrophota bacterium]